MTRYSSKSWRAFQPDAPRGAPVVDRAPVAAPRVAGGRGPCRILGLDPGSLRTGFGIIDIRGPDMGCVVHGRIEVKGASLAQRMARIHAGVSELLERYAPDEIAVERVFVNKNIDSALKLGQARGAALAALGVDSVVFEYAPRAIKLAAVGFGAADKVQVAHMMRQLLRIDGILTPDASDALAVAVCHAQTRRLAALVAAPDVAPLASAGRR